MTTSAKPRSRCRQGQRGAVLVEMALVVTLLLMIAAGIVEFGRIFWYYDALSKATRNAARYMSAVSALDMKNSSQAAAAVSTAQDIVLTAVNSTHISPPLVASNVAVSCDNGACGGAVPTNVSVAITGYQVTPGSWFPFVALAGGRYASVVLTPSTTMRYMN